ncbi:MAG: MBOAT family protein [Lachnospiraceae bacterium]|nr:MBOAT family protein [Lachnospiraceae bacterium]
MLFNSFIFVLLFLPITIVIYFLINRAGRYTAAKVFLLAMSLWFYCYSEPWNVIVLIASILVNYAIAVFGFIRVKKPAGRKALLILGISLNLLSLFYFKYIGFFFRTLNHLFQTTFTFESLILPLGISFFTFGQIAFLVDSYRDPETRYGFLDYALFTAFFPKISVGPIAFAKEMIPDFSDDLKKQADFENIAKGLVLFSFGLAKKAILADSLAACVDWGYNNLPSADSAIAILMVVGYSLQIYFDFSGYCDMAMGICQMLNLSLPLNFDSPYRALSINDFWKRWHITLTRFFRQYVYFPLGGSRKGKVRTYLNIMIIFLLSGLWHGANYTFVFWGFLHGVGICLSKAFGKYTQKLPKVIRAIFMFFYVNLTWVFFRSATIEQAFYVIKKLFAFHFTPISDKAVYVAAASPAEFGLLEWLLSLSDPDLPVYVGLVLLYVLLIIGILCATLMKTPVERIRQFQPTKKLLAATVLLLVWSIISLSDISTFIYTNF